MVLSKKWSRVVLFTDLVSTSFGRCQHLDGLINVIAYLIDAAHTETKSTALNTSSVHIIADEKD